MFFHQPNVKIVLQFWKKFAHAQIVWYTSLNFNMAPEKLPSQ